MEIPKSIRAYMKMAMKIKPIIVVVGEHRAEFVESLGLFKAKDMNPKRWFKKAIFRNPVFGTFPSINFEYFISVMEGLYRIPKMVMPACMDIFIETSMKNGEPIVRKIVEIIGFDYRDGEILANMVFGDAGNFSGKSFVFETIMHREGMSKEQIIYEYKNQEKVGE